MIELPVGESFHDDDAPKRIPSPATHPPNGSRKTRAAKNGGKQFEKKQILGTPADLAATSTSKRPKPKRPEPWRAMVQRAVRVTPQEHITSLYPPGASAPVGGTYHPELSQPLFTSNRS
jgi:hypothetical protein